MTGRLIDRFLFAATLTVTLTLGACSVKEDRSVCPSVLRVILSSNEVSEALDSAWVSIYREGESTPVVCSLESVTALTEGLVEFEVPRSGTLRVVVTAGTDFTFSGDRLFPQDASSMIEGFSSVDVGPDCENADTHVSLRRDCMKVNIILDTTVPGCVVTLRSTFSGLSVPEGTPVPPEYIAEAAAVTEDVYAVYIPRQNDSSEIVLSVDVVSPSTGETIRLGYFVLSDILRENGYDWTEDILRDVTVTFGADMLLEGVSVEDWSSEEINPTFG